MGSREIVTRAMRSNGRLPTPLPVTEHFFREVEHRALFLYGIFNPMGPTWNIVALVEPTGHGSTLICHRMLNPFAIEGNILAACAAEDEIVETTAALFADNTAELLGSAPTWILPVAGEPPLSEALPLAMRAFALQHASGLSEETKLYVEFKSRPWDRLSAETTAPRTAPLPSEEEVQLWLQTVLDEDHLFPELLASAMAWQGAIDFQKSTGGLRGAGLGVLRDALHQAGVDWLDPVFDKVEGQAGHPG
jgi:hypothetical protein